MIEVELSTNEASVFVARLRERAPAANPVYDDGTLFVDDSLQSDVDAVITDGLALTKDELKAYAASVRYYKEVAGTTVNGVSYPTDRETQAKLTAAALFAQVDNAQTFQWKLADGSFSESLSAAQMIAVAAAVGGYVNSCFPRKRQPWPTSTPAPSLRASKSRSRSLDS
jgi:hypothetical protein